MTTTIQIASLASNDDPYINVKDWISKGIMLFVTVAEGGAGGRWTGGADKI
jgi:hypothetical protein